MNRTGIISAQATARRALIVIFVCGCWQLAAHAVTTNWINNSGGTFTTSANWDNGVPDSDDTAAFNRGAGVAYHVVFPGGGIFDPPPSYGINSLRVHSNSVTFRDNSSEFITRPNLTVGNTADAIVVGQNAGEAAILTTSLNQLTSGVSASAFIGRLAGSDGTLNVAAGTFSLPGFGDLNVGDSGTGRLNVTGGSVTNLNGIIARSAGSTGSATVTGASSTWTNGGDLLVGREGAGTLRVEAGGRVVANTKGVIGSSVGSTGTATVTGAGSTWTNNNAFDVGAVGMGTLRIEAGGSVSNTRGIIGSMVGSTGTVTVTGAGSTWTNLNQLDVGSSGTGTLNVENGANVSSQIGLIGALAGSNGAVTVSGSGSVWSTVSTFSVGLLGRGTLTIQDGGAVSSGSGGIGFEFGSEGTVTVSGLGSTWTTGSLSVGANESGTLRIEGGGGVSSGLVFLGGETESSTVTVTGIGSTFTSSSVLRVGNGARDGTLLVKDGGSVSTINSLIGPDTLDGTGSVTVTGAGATWNSNGTMYVGGNVDQAGSVGVITVETGGVVNIGQDLVIWDKGTIKLHGGRLNLASGDDLIFSDGAFNFSFGTLHFTASQTIGAAGSIVQALGGERRLHLGQHLEIDGALALSAPFQIDGGHLETDSLVVNSDLLFNAGVLEVRNGSITGLTSLVVPGSGELRTRGTHSFRVTGLAGSTITATGNLTLGNASAANGFGTQGTLSVGANTVTLLDSNEVVFDSLALVTLGNGGSAGTLAVANGLTLDFGANVTGVGAVNTPNDPVRPLINNGHIRGNSAAQRVTLSGYVKGVGTLDNVLITGTDAPGFSAATVYRGSVAYQGALEVEIGGATPGSFDRIIHSGAAALGGALRVTLINGFSPTAGSSFDVLDWASRNGIFSTIQLPSLGDLLTWDTSQLYATGVLSVVSAPTFTADFDEDGDVDANDLSLWRTGFGATGTATHMQGDADEDGDVDGADFLTWHRQLGSGLPTAGSSAAVPEPAAVVLNFVAFAACVDCRWPRPKHERARRQLRFYIGE
jgi:T5SS/PEP-CTERM-associated repeat protein